jgi:very-short-patch-repair endonuclease
VARIVARQHGVIAHAQLIELGVLRDSVRRRLAAERLFEVQPFVYSLIPEVKIRGRMMAAVLTFGADAVLSHRAAAAVWEIGPWPTGVVDVTLARTPGPRRGIRLHRAHVDHVVKDGLPLTTLTRTLVDQASHLPLPRLRNQFEAAERLGLLDVKSVTEQMHGRRGAKKIRALIADWITPEPTRSELERAFRDLCRQSGLPLPSQNVSLLGYEVDAVWEQDRLVVELDGWEHHRTRRAFEDDRRRAAALEAAGYRVLRFTWRQVTRDRRIVARAVSRRLQRAGS